MSPRSSASRSSPNRPTRSVTDAAAAPPAGAPLAFDAARYRDRNVVERSYAAMKQWRGLATRYDKLAVIYRAAAVMHDVITWCRHIRDTP